MRITEGDQGEHQLSIRCLRPEWALRWAQATGVDAWAPRVKCPARLVSHWHNILVDLFTVKPLGIWNRPGTPVRLLGGVSLKIRLLHRIQRDRSWKGHQHGVFDIVLFQVMGDVSDDLMGTKQLLTCNDVVIYILYQMTLKLKLSYLNAILVCGRFHNKVASKFVFTWNIISLRFIFLRLMKFGLSGVQLGKTDSR